MAESFGARLRAYRTAANLSIGELSREIKYSKGYLSKIENDRKPPTAMVAKLCDNALNAEGALIALAPVSSASVVPDPAHDDEVWVMSLDESGDLRFHQIGRRQLLAGAGLMAGFAFTRGGGRPPADEPVLAEMRASFDNHRRRGMLTSPVLVLGEVIAHLNTLRGLSVDCPEPVRSEVLRLASRVAEYAGWMCQEAGDDRAALGWTRRAVAFAAAGRDRQLAGYALDREAGIALYRQDAISTIDLARRAQTLSDPGPRVRGLAARREAQGHALAGDLDACLRAFDRAAELLAVAEPDGTGPVLGSSSVTDPLSLARGWALCDLGRTAEATGILDRVVPAIPMTSRRARARFGTRRALAHASGGEIDHACLVIREVLDDVVQVDSATVRLDLRQLARTLARWRNHVAVRETYPELTRALTAPHVTN